MAWTLSSFIMILFFLVTDVFVWQISKGTVTEISVADKAEELRR